MSAQKQMKPCPIHGFDVTVLCSDADTSDPNSYDQFWPSCRQNIQPGTTRDPYGCPYNARVSGEFYRSMGAAIDAWNSAVDAGPTQ